MQVGGPAVELPALHVRVPGEPWLLRQEVARGDENVGARRDPAARARPRARCWRRPCPRGATPRRAVTSRAPTSTPFARAFSSVASIAAASMSTPSTGAKPSSAAAIERTPEPQPTSSSDARLELLQQREAELRRRMRAGAERAARVDDDERARPPAAPPTAGRPRARPTRTGWWNVAPALLPAVLDLRAVRRPKTCQSRSSPAASVYATSSTPPGRSTSSNPCGKSSSMAARASSARRCSDLDRDPPEADSAERALQLVEEAFVGPVGVLVARRSNSSSSRRCSSVRRRGTRDVHEHAVVAAPEALEHRHALAAQHTHLARLRSGRELELDRPVERLDASPSRRATPGRSSGRPARRCRCPRARNAGRVARGRGRRRRPRALRAEPA